MATWDVAARLATHFVLYIVHQQSHDVPVHSGCRPILIEILGRLLRRGGPARFFNQGYQPFEILELLSAERCFADLISVWQRQGGVSHLVCDRALVVYLFLVLPESSVHAEAPIPKLIGRNYYLPSMKA